MEKQAIIKEGITPAEEPDKKYGAEKQAQAPTPEQLEEHVTIRASKRALDRLARKRPRL